MAERGTSATTGDESSALSVHELLAQIAGAVTDEQITDALTRGAAAIIKDDLIHRLVPYAARLRDIDYCEAPWAALPGGVAVCAIDRPQGRRILAAARERFQEEGNETGEGWASFLEGLEDLGEGRLDSAVRWWGRACELLENTNDSEHVIAFASLNLCLGAYASGDLERAALIAERALHEGRRYDDPRIEMIAGVYLALFRWWQGSFAAVENAAFDALQAATRIADPLDRYDEPLVHGAIAAVAYVRGDTDAGDVALDRGIAKADDLHNGWHAAILRTIRAQLTAATNPRRSLRDARHALAYYDRIGERWWSHWALEAYISAQRESGDLGASLTAAGELLAVVDNPLERGRARLEHGATLIALERSAEAAESLAAAVTDLEQAGARYLLARAELLLARCVPSRGEFLIRSARARAGADAADPAWRRLLRGGPVLIRLFGPPRVEVDGRVVSFSTRQEVEAIAFLAFAGDAGVPADRLADALWPDSEAPRARHRLDVLLSSARRAMLPATRLLREHNVVRLDVDDAECDVRQAWTLGRSGLAGSRRDAAEALALLHAPLLSGSYREWVVAEQLRFDALADALRRAHPELDV